MRTVLLLLILGVAAGNTYYLYKLTKKVTKVSYTINEGLENAGLL